MKNNLFSLLSVFLLVSFSIGFSLNTTIRNNQNGAEISGKFGKGSNCLRAGGVCSMQSSGDARLGEVPDFKGKIFFNEFDQLVLAIYKSEISSEEFIAELEKDEFELDKTIQLTNTMMQELSPPNNYRLKPEIKKGMYKIVEKEDVYEIVILEL